MKIVTIAAALAAVTSMSGCLPGETENTEMEMEMPDPDPVTTFQDYVTEIEATRATIENFASTETSTLPEVGSTAYSGVFRANLDSENGTGTDAAVGLLTITALWDDNAITGSVTEMVDGDNGAYIGDLTISNGAIADRVTADVGGTIENAASESLTVDGVMTGDFYSDILYIEGGMDGTVTGPDGETILDGGWAASDR